PAGAGDHHDATVEPQTAPVIVHDLLSPPAKRAERVSRAHFCPDKIWHSARWRTLFRSADFAVKAAPAPFRGYCLD
ncbi:hypothetical protein, partial [Mycobacterium sp. UM_3]|uniref:hypothetical protein n=1 Tax=Mycobacterium sp. UM_3 TaxID=1638774 RepID=UPI001E514D71